MRIAQVCPYSLSVPGGVQGQVLGLARTMRAMGHEVRVLAPCDGPPPDPMVTPLGMSVPTASNGSMAPIAPDPACALRTIHALRNERFDVLHLHEPMVPGPTFTSLLVSDVRTIGTFHASGTATSYNYLPWVTKWMAKKLAVRTAVSVEARNTAVGSLGGSYEVLFNGIEIERFSSASPFPTEGPTILFVGRHETRKGLPVLIDAMSMLPNDVRLWIAGVGPQTSELKRITAGDARIEWLGRIDDEEKASRLKAVDVLCAPSVGGESFGMVLLEAMAARTAIVATDIAGYRHVATDEVDSLLVPPNDASVLATAIERVLGNATLADELTTNAMARAKEFSMQRLATEYLRVFKA